MGIRLNLYANKQNGSNERLRKSWDNIKWGPRCIERDEFGIPIKKDSKQTKGGPVQCRPTEMTGM
jgi:hypothetical protein